MVLVHSTCTLLCLPSLTNTGSPLERVALLFPVCEGGDVEPQPLLVSPALHSAVAGFGFCCVRTPKLASLLQVENKTPPARDERGRLLPGGTANPRGRPALPDFFKDAAPLALQHLVNVATGVEFVEPELRLKAATLVVERFYGKAPETVTLEGELAISRIVRTIVDPKSDG